MQLLSLLHTLFSIPSSSLSLISGVIALITYLVFDFPFNASTSASLTSSRSSFVLKTNFPLTANRFPFLGLGVHFIVLYIGLREKRLCLA
jgi:hypothetical protein